VNGTEALMVLAGQKIITTWWM